MTQTAPNVKIIIFGFKLSIYPTQLRFYFRFNLIVCMIIMIITEQRLALLLEVLRRLHGSWETTQSKGDRLMLYFFTRLERIWSHGNEWHITWNRSNGKLNKCTAKCCRDTSYKLHRELMEKRMLSCCSDASLWLMSSNSCICTHLNNLLIPTNIQHVKYY